MLSIQGKHALNWNDLSAYLKHAHKNIVLILTTEIFP